MVTIIGNSGSQFSRSFMRFYSTGKEIEVKGTQGKTL